MFYACTKRQYLVATQTWITWNNGTSCIKNLAKLTSLIDLNTNMSSFSLGYRNFSVAAALNTDFTARIPKKIKPLFN